MRPRIVVLIILLATGMARPMFAQYTVNTAAENAFAEAEHTLLGTRPTPVTVPHLDPATVIAEMSDSKYLGFPGSSTKGFHFVIAHRGSHTAPGCAENGACAIAAAYEAGADAIELDVKVTQDNAPVLGHDVAVARELDSWIPPTATVLKERTVGPFTYFPLLDPVYLDITKYPFLNNFALPAGFENDTATDNTNSVVTIDWMNPPRTALTLSQIQNGVLADTYDRPTANHQLTLYEALYLIAKYYPMAIFLDVKNASDLAAVKPAITAIMQQFSSKSALHEIAFKLSFATLIDPRVSYNPAQTIGQLNAAYFMVIGTGDLFKMAGYVNRIIPSTPADEVSGVLATIRALCVPSTGCLGVELNHKYVGAPTQGVFNGIQAMQSFALASFQTVPQYSWHWQQQPSQKIQSVTFGRTFPRTDGSCCFALTDALNVSPISGAESGDLRNLYSWNENNFTTITTDEPLLALQDLYQQGYRNIATAQNIFSTSPNVNVPSGGSSPAGVRDGLYYIQTNINGNNLVVDGSVAGFPLVTNSHQLSQMWYFSGKAGSIDTITNAANGWNLLNEPVSGKYYLEAPGNVQAQFFSLKPLGGSSFQIISPANGSPQTMVVASSSSPMITSRPDPTNYTSSFALVPVSTPSSEYAQQSVGPNGYVYCADGDQGQACNFSGPASVAYGATSQGSPQFGITFRYLQYVKGPISCNLATFGGIDPASGVKKACFYAPYDITSTPSLTYNTATVSAVKEHSTFQQSIGMSWIFGAKNSDGVWLETYTYLNPGHYTCDSSAFGYDPAPNIVKMCYAAPSAPAGPTRNFAFCANSGENCPFSGTAVIAMGASGGWTYKTFTNGVACSATSFGANISSSGTPACFIMPYMPLGSTTNSTLDGQIPGNAIIPYGFLNLCAVDGGTCTANDGALVAFGKGSSSVFKVLSRTFTCNLATFGNVDPAPGQNKSCYVDPYTNFANRGPAGFSFCAGADIGQTCAFTGVAQVAYGVDGQFVIMPNAQSGVACALASFGSDPAVSYQKSCYYRLYQ